MSFSPAKSAFSRVFLIEGRARPDHVPVFQSCLRAGAISQGFGDITRIECPSPDRFGAFDEVGTIQAAIERATMTLTGRYASDLASVLLEMAKRRCSADAHINFGTCTDPKLANTFTKKLILENVSQTNYSTDELGALSSDENNVVNEMTDLSIGEVFEALPMGYAKHADSLLTNEAVDVVICDRVACAGDCDDESSGCERVYALVGGILGSPGTPPDIVYTIDGGATWDLDEVTSLLATESADALACLGDYMVVVSLSSVSLEWKLKSVLDAGTTFNWTEVTTGFAAGGGPNDIWSVGNYAFIVGNAGYVYGTADPTAGVTVLDAGVTTVQNLAAVHALDDSFAVAVGAADAIVYTVNQTTWQTATATGSGAALTAVWCKNEDEWFVGTAGGRIYYTVDGGTTWTLSPALPGGATQIDDIQFSTDSVGFACGHLANVAKAWITWDGGQSWVLQPASGTMPAGREFNALAACPDDINFVALVGEGAVANDGIIVFGAD